MKNEYDLLKVFAILLVVLGHITILYGGGSFLPYNSILTKLTKAIYLFHMPLFVALSGAIYSIGCERGKYSSFIPFAHNKVNRILLPFFFVAVLFLAPTLVALGKTELSFLSVCGNILMGGGLEKHLWYLPALFWIFMIVWCLQKARIKVWIMFVSSVVLAVVCSLFFSFKFLFLWDTIQYLPYFLWGMFIHEYGQVGNKKLLGVGIISFVVMAAMTKATSIEWLDNICRVLLPCSIVISLTAIARTIVPFKENQLMTWLLKQSFAIYLFHVMVIYIMYHFIGVYLTTAVMVPITLVVSIGVSWAMAWLCRKLHLQFIIGEKIIM